MTQEIIDMDRQARLHRNQHNLASNPVQYMFTYDGTEEALIAFYKLATAKEREACAKVCEHLNSTEDYYGERIELFCAEAIRARDEA